MEEEQNQTCQKCKTLTGPALSSHKYQYHFSYRAFEDEGVFYEMSRDEDSKLDCSLCHKRFATTASLGKHFKQEHPTFELVKENKRNYGAFSYQQGCEETYGISDKAEQKHKMQKVYQTTGMDLQPVKLNFQALEDQSNTTASIFCFMKNSTALSLHRLRENMGKTGNGHLKCSINFTKESSLMDTTSDVQKNSNSIQSSDSAFVEMDLQIQSSNYPKLIDKVGPYLEINAELIALLSSPGIKKSPKKLAIVSELFAGSMVHLPNYNLLILTCENYGRFSTTDIHMEEDGVSIPDEFETSAYDGLTIDCYNQADAGGTVDKLIIGSLHWNLLITCSLIVYPPTKDCLNIGPSIDSFTVTLNLKKARIYFRQKNVNRFKDTIMKEDIDIVYSGGIANLRQLTSAFNDQSTYLPLCATLFTDSIVHSPATNFTICDLPYSKFDFSADSDCRYGSFFLKCIGESALFRENMIKKNDLEEFLSKYTAISFKNDSTWKYFHTSVKNMCTQLENGQSVNVLKFFSDEKLAKLPTMLTSTVSQANKWIKEILLEKLSKGFN